MINGLYDEKLKETVDIRDSLNLIPALSYISHHKKEILQEVRRYQDIGSVSSGLA